MISRLPAVALIALFPALVWYSSPTHVNAFLSKAADGGRRRFESNSRQDTELHPHRFNGGYDPASPLTWTPHQAAEFTIFHEGTPQHAGMQLRTTIQHWSGADLAQFLTRLYLGHLITDVTKDNDAGYKSSKKVVYEPRNVRTPQWEGLDTREGILALKDLLREALPKEILSAQEISRFAENFLLKEYRWPIRIRKSNSTSISHAFSNSKIEVDFEHDSFYSLGHAQTIARVLLAVRKERGSDEFNSNDIALMLTLPEKRDEDREVMPMKMIDFFRTISAYTSLTAIDKANVVERMAIAGWLSGSIAKFMAELLPAETLSEDHAVDEIWRLQGDAFLDFPTAATAAETSDTNKEAQSSAVDEAIAKVAKVIGKEQNTLSSKRPSAVKDTVQSEYDELVQSYWKKVEVTTNPKTKQPLEAYGVPKTKSIKKREISKKSIVDSKCTK
jgi:hypothetical protein